VFDHNLANGLRPIPHYKASPLQNAGRRRKLTAGTGKLHFCRLFDRNTAVNWSTAMPAPAAS